MYTRMRQLNKMLPSLLPLNDCSRRVIGHGVEQDLHAWVEKAQSRVQREGGQRVGPDTAARIWTLLWVGSLTERRLYQLAQQCGTIRE